MFITLQSYFQQLFHILNNDNNHLIIMTVYLGAYLLAVVLRVTACVGCRAALAAVQLGVKEINVREDIKKIRSGLLKKIAADYIKIAEKSVSRIPASALVDRQVGAMGLINWRYDSIINFVESLENGLVFVGLILAFTFNNYIFLYGTMAAGGFAVTRLAVAVFDYRSVRSQLAGELLIFTEREIGRFYAADSGGAVLRLKDELSGALLKLKDELSGAITKQSAVLDEAIAKIGSQFAESTDGKLEGIYEGLRKIIRELQTALAEAGKIQNETNAGAEKMKISSESLMSASDLLARHLKGHSGVLSEQLIALTAAVNAVNTHSERMFSGQDAILAQSRYIEQNQKTLEITIQSYETALQSVTQNLGDGLGAYLKLHTQNAVQSVNDTLAANVEKIIRQNQETLARMAELFDQLRGQSKDISANLLTLHEKIAQQPVRAGGAADG